MQVDGTSTPIFPFPFPHRPGQDTTVRRDGDDIVLDAGRGDDEIHVRRGQDGNYNVNVNGVDYCFTPDEFARLKIKGGRGNDRITVDGSVDQPVRVDGGRGDDTIINRADGADLRGGRGDDTIVNHSNGSTIRGGRGDDTVYNDGIGNDVRGNRGDDRIQSNGAFNRVHGGRGDDKIDNTGWFNQVRGWRGDDDIFSVGPGNDVRGGPGCDREYDLDPLNPFGNQPCGGPWGDLGQMNLAPWLFGDPMSALGGAADVAGTLGEGLFWNTMMALGHNPWGVGTNPPSFA